MYYLHNLLFNADLRFQYIEISLKVRRKQNYISKVFLTSINLEMHPEFDLLLAIYLPCLLLVVGLEKFEISSLYYMHNLAYTRPFSNILPHIIPKTIVFQKVMAIEYYQSKGRATKEMI